MQTIETKTERKRAMSDAHAIYHVTIGDNRKGVFVKATCISDALEAGLKAHAKYYKGDVSFKTFGSTFRTYNNEAGRRGAQMKFKASGRRVQGFWPCHEVFAEVIEVIDAVK